MAEVYFRSKTYTQNYPKHRIPSFDGFLNLEAFLYWIQTVDDFFDFTEVQRDEQEFLVARKLRGFAKYWWERFQNQRLYQGKKEIMSWKKMRVILFDRFYQFEEDEDEDEDDEIWADYSRDGDFYLQSAAQDIDDEDEENEIEVYGTGEAIDEEEKRVSDEDNTKEEAVDDGGNFFDFEATVAKTNTKEEATIDLADDSDNAGGAVSTEENGSDHICEKEKKSNSYERENRMEEKKWAAPFNISFPQPPQTLDLIEHAAEIPMGQVSLGSFKPTSPSIFIFEALGQHHRFSLNLPIMPSNPNLNGEQIFESPPILPPTPIPCFSPSIPIPPKPNFTFTFYDPFLVDPIKKNENFSIYFPDFNFKRQIQRHPSPWILLFASFLWPITLVPLWLWEEVRRAFSIGVFFSSAGPNSRSSSFFLVW